MPSTKIRLDKLGREVKKAMHVVADKSAWLATGIVLFMMAVTGSDVIGRYVFRHGVPGSYEINEILMLVLVFSVISKCTVERDHIRVDLVVSHLRRGIRTVLFRATTFASLVIFSLIAWQLVARAVGELLSPFVRTTGTLLLPTVPFLLVASAGAVLVCFALLVNLFGSEGAGK